MESEPRPVGRPEVRAEARAIFFKRATLLLLGLVLALALGVMLYTVVAVRGTQQANKPTIDNTARTLSAVVALAEKIDSCTDPSGACAKRGQRQTAAAVGNISLSQVAAVACADRPGTQSATEIRACVGRTLRVFKATHSDPGNRR